MGRNALDSFGQQIARRHVADVTKAKHSDHPPVLVDDRQPADLQFLHVPSCSGPWANGEASGASKIMSPHRLICPCCQRTLRGVLDYPRVRVLSFERLPLPEAVDTMSEAAAEKWLARRRKYDPGDFTDPRRAGINMTPAIEQACSTPAVADYLQRLSSLAGQSIKPRKLLPPRPGHGVFKWAYPIPGTGLYLSLGEPDEAPANGTVAEVQVHCAGPNLGSAGGPTLQRLGPIACLGYAGMLADGASPARVEKRSS